MGLANYTDEQLEKELKRRKEERNKYPKPTPLRNIDWKDVKRLCIRYIEDMGLDEDDVDEDYPIYIYEAAIEAVFGGEVWKWINARLI